MKEMVDYVAFPEDLYTDSPVHVSQQSDEEFKKQRDFLACFIQKQAAAETEPWNAEIELWNQEMRSQFLRVLERRAGKSLPHPEPIDIKIFEQKDMLAIFSKMHSRPFVRSFRLCKDVNKLLNKNLTKFSIRVREGQLTANISKDESERESKRLNFCRGGATGWTTIDDHSAIVPFTFSKSWFGTVCLGLVEQMKWPFERREVNLRSIFRLHSRLWTGLDRLSFSIEYQDQDWKQMFVENWKLCKDLKPKEIRFNLPVDAFPLRDLLDAAPSIYLLFLPQNYGISRIIQELRSGEWNPKATYIGGTVETTREKVYRVVTDGFSFQLADHGARTIFMVCSDSSYVSLTWSAQSFGGKLWQFKIIRNIRLVSDLLPYENDIFPGSERYPIDYSEYSGDLDSAIHPQAFCALFVNYINAV